MKSINKIRNGSLYYNEGTHKVERVLGAVNSQRVWTKRHKNSTKDVRIKDLRIAEEQEVDRYVMESKLTPPKPSLPPLPQVKVI